MPRAAYLGELELMVLLTLDRLEGEAYGMAVYDEIVRSTGREISAPTIYVTLARLEKKGAIRHIERDLRYVYVPAVTREEAQESALSRLVRVFYDGSLSSAVTGMVEHSEQHLTDKELENLEAAIRGARERRQQ